MSTKNIVEKYPMPIGDEIGLVVTFKTKDGQQISYLCTTSWTKPAFWLEPTRALFDGDRIVARSPSVGTTGGATVEIKFTLEDGLKEVVESRGAMAQIEQAVFKTILRLKTDYYARQSQVQGRGSFVGVQKT